MIWSTKQIEQVRGLRCTMEIQEMGDHLPDEVRDHIAMKFRVSAFPMGVDVARGDVQVIVLPISSTFGTEITAYWDPPTKEVEVRGTSSDGRVWLFENAPYGSLKVPNQSFGDPMTLECVGWNEAARRWVYGIPDAD